MKQLRTLGELMEHIKDIELKGKLVINNNAVKKTLIDLPNYMWVDDELWVVDDDD